MRTGVNGFQPERLIQARTSLGITRVALATLVGVSPATISYWEKGTQCPEEEKLQALSDAIKFPTSWFLKDVPNHGNSPYFYRTLDTSTKAAREMAKVRLNWVAEIAGTLSNWVNWPPVRIPFSRESSIFKITDAEIEQLAQECRKAWGLGLHPIEDIILTLENAGVICARDEIGYIKMDGVSHWSQLDGKPYIFITSDKANGIRNRFDVAHELGHLVLHRYVDDQTLKKNHKEIERQANYFAGCFLLPAESFSSEIKWPTLENFLYLKRRWKVSVAAMIMRSHQLDIIDDDQKLRLMKSRSKRGWVKGEPYDDMIPFETPRLLNRAVKMLVNEGVLSKQDIVFKIGPSKSAIESLSSLPRGYLSSEVRQSDNLIELKRKSKNKSRSSKLSSPGDVLNFPKNS